MSFWEGIALTFSWSLATFYEDMAFPMKKTCYWNRTILFCSAVNECVLIEWKHLSGQINILQKFFPKLWFLPGLSKTSILTILFCWYTYSYHYKILCWIRYTHCKWWLSNLNLFHSCLFGGIFSQMARRHLTAIIINNYNYWYFIVFQFLHSATDSNCRW